MDTAPGHDAGRHGTSAAAGPSRVLANAPDLLALREAFAAMIPAAMADPGAPDAAHPAGPASIASPDGVESEAIDRIAVLEQLKAAVTAAQMRETAALHTHRITAEARRGVPVQRRGRGLGGEIGLARRIGPHTGSTELRKAVNVVADLPKTLAALRAGTISESHAAAVERQTQWLDSGSRRAVDSHLAGLFGYSGVRDLTRAAQAEAVAQDPEAATERYDAARRDRHVSVKPSESTPGMAYLTAFLPIEQAAACYKNLVETAARRIAEGEAWQEHVAGPTDGPERRGGGQERGDRVGGDRESGRDDGGHEGRTPGQVLADTLVERLTGQPGATAVPVEVHLVMTDASLFGSTAPGTAPPHTAPGTAPPRTAPTGGSPPETVTDAPGVGSPPGSRAAAARAAWLPGFGPIPAPTARRLVAGTEAEVFLRRLYTAPATGQLVAMDSQRRTFSGGLRRMIVIRDGTCRTPFCGAPIRHLDHATPFREGGATSYQNGSGLCVRCNLTKEHPGWSHDATAESLTVTTPTGHRYTRPTAPLQPPPHTVTVGSAECAENPETAATPETPETTETTVTAVTAVTADQAKTPADPVELGGPGHSPRRRPRPALVGPVDFGVPSPGGFDEYEPQHHEAA
ncbi:DUF222 domain-containing protein [Microbacterium sp. A93]|uniref:HNH endonuclease n=1 Tax=Microbacterium sp. A93 TaxID=3450716 RepID=UPI003F4400C3